MLIIVNRRNVFVQENMHRGQDILEAAGFEGSEWVVIRLPRDNSVEILLSEYVQVQDGDRFRVVPT
mgnify:CR=1 FL=1